MGIVYESHLDRMWILFAQDYVVQMWIVDGWMTMCGSHYELLCVLYIKCMWIVSNFCQQFICIECWTVCGSY